MNLSRITTPGRIIFSLAIIALGVETILCRHSSVSLYPPLFPAIPILPFLPPIPALAVIFGIIFAALGAGLLIKRYSTAAAITLGSLLFLCTIVLEIPKYAVVPRSMSLRTLVFEPLAIAALAFLLPGRNAISSLLDRAARFLLCLSFLVFGVDHFLALRPIGTLVPHWIPFHVFWIAFFGVVFIASGLSIGLDILLRWGAAGVGLMFAIWVFTLHIPRVLGFYGVTGGPRSPDEWSSLFIAVALWGGSWALVSEPRSSFAKTN